MLKVGNSVFFTWVGLGGGDKFLGGPKRVCVGGGGGEGSKFFSPAAGVVTDVTSWRKKTVMLKQGRILFGQHVLGFVIDM